MEFVSSSTRSERQSGSSAARVTSWSSREGAGARRLLVSMVLLLVPARAGRMSAAKYKEATRALSDGAEWVIGEGAHYFWRAHAAMATPPAAGESWYLHSGSAQLPTGVQALIKKPDGTPATRSPDSAAMLNYRTSGGVVWPEHAGGHLLFPRLWAMLPPSCKRAVLWNPATSKLDGVSARGDRSQPGRHGHTLRAVRGAREADQARAVARHVCQRAVGDTCSLSSLRHPAARAGSPMTLYYSIPRPADILSRHRERLCSVVA